MRYRTAAAALAAIVVSAVPAASAYAGGGPSSGCTWTQWGQGAAHNGMSCAAGQRGLRVLAQLTVDPFAAQEVAENANDILGVNFPAPLLDTGGNVYIMEKAGHYASCDPPGSGVPAPCGPAAINQQIWTEHAMVWRHNQLVPRWVFASDWKPLPGTNDGLFQSALGERYLYVPGAGGTVFQVDKRTGAAVRRVNPFGTTVDPSTYITGGLTLDTDGDLYYNAVKVVPGGDSASWLVKVPARGPIRMADYRTLVPDAPKPTDQCYGTFYNGAPPPATPWPPAPRADGTPTLPPQAPCLSQRVATNVAPTIGPDGTIFTVSRSQNSQTSNYTYMIALRPDLRLKWATSMRGKLADGCGVLTPYGTGTFDCRAGATVGIDPLTNLPPALEAPDFNSASPTALPDGGVLFGGYTQYNGFRGHLMKFDARGRFQTSYDVGEGMTAPVYRHDHTYSLITKDNHYITGGPFYITRLDADLHIEWQARDTSTQTCARQPDGTVSCVDNGEHPNGFEWCISSPAFDRNGTLYGISEDGYLYALDRSGNVRERVFLDRSIQESYTPTAIDPAGRVYAQNNGKLYVVGH